MGLRGPMALSESELKARGTYRKDRHLRRGESVYPRGTPDRPTFIVGRAREVWAELAKVLADRLTPADRAAFSCLVETIVDFETACAEHKRNPTAQSRSDKRAAANFLTKACCAFGMTPATRAKIQTLSEQPKTNSKSRFFKQ